MKVNIGKYHNNGAPRTIKVQIDPWDTVSADHTLALIILPLLKQYRKNLNGAPYVETDDVPPEMYQEVDSYDGWNKRWAWVIDEMILAFERIVNDDWSADVPCENWVKEEERIDNGLRLFGKYFRGLWT
jgi:hypothetical protein